MDSEARASSAVPDARGPSSIPRIPDEGASHHARIMPSPRRAPPGRTRTKEAPMSGSQALIGPVVVLNYTLRSLPVVAQKVHDGIDDNAALFVNLSVSLAQLSNDIEAYAASLSAVGKLATATKKSFKRKL